MLHEQPELAYLPIALILLSQGEQTYCIRQILGQKCKESLPACSLGVMEWVGRDEFPVQGCFILI